MPTPPEPGGAPATVATQGPKHEESDVWTGWIFGSGALLVAGAIVMHFVLGWQLRALKATPLPQDTWSAFRRAAEPAAAAPRSFPRLQLGPTRDMEAFRRSEQEVLESYGWVNQTAGVVRIPVQRSMQVILQRAALPVAHGTNGRRIGKSPLELQQERARENERGAGQR